MNLISNHPPGISCSLTETVEFCECYIKNSAHSAFYLLLLLSLLFREIWVCLTPKSTPQEALPPMGGHEAGSNSWCLLRHGDIKLHLGGGGGGVGENPTTKQIPIWVMRISEPPDHMKVFICSHLLNRHVIRNPGANFGMGAIS